MFPSGGAHNPSGRLPRNTNHRLCRLLAQSKSRAGPNGGTGAPVEHATKLRDHSSRPGGRMHNGVLPTYESLRKWQSAKLPSPFWRSSCAGAPFRSATDSLPCGQDPAERRRSFTPRPSDGGAPGGRPQLPRAVAVTTDPSLCLGGLGRGTLRPQGEGLADASC